MKRVRLLTFAAIALLAVSLPASGSAERAAADQRSSYTAFDAALTIAAGVILPQPVDVRFESGPDTIAISRQGASLVWPLPRSVAPAVASLASSVDDGIDAFFQSLLRGAAVANGPTR